KKIKDIIKYWFETSIYLYNTIKEKLKATFDIPEYSNYYYLKYFSFKNKEKNFGTFDGYTTRNKNIRIQSNDFKNRKDYNNLYVTLNLFIRPEEIREIEELLENITNSNYNEVEEYFEKFYEIDIDKFEKHFMRAFEDIIKNQNPIILDSNVKEYFMDFYVAGFDEDEGIF
ncbi:MAG: hypothetical protein ABDH49_09390, partial [Candidatus Hydrothermales bacterium]